MSSGGDHEILISRLDLLDRRVQQLQRRCRRLAYALAVLAAVALGTPLALMIYTSFGSELRAHRVVADRVILPRTGELIIGDERNGARLGHISDVEYGLTFFWDKQEVIGLKSSSGPTLTFRDGRRVEHFEDKSCLRL